MRRYFDYALLWDLLIAIIIGTIFFISYPTLFGTLKLPNLIDLNGFGVSLITVSSTIIGFLLTIITIIVTFKKGFEDKTNNIIKTDSIKDFSEENVFEKKISKESKFYGTAVHKHVVSVFVNATYEIGIVLFFLLALQFGICNLSIYWITVFSLCSFILIILSIIRSLYIFKLFLKIHLND